MMKYGAFTQIAIAIIAVVIVFTYVRPTFMEIGDIQDNLADFDAAIEQVSRVNSQLASLVTQVNDVSVADRRALLTYMPDRIDHVAVLRDLQTMVEVAGANVSTVSYGGHEMPEGTGGNAATGLLPAPVKHSFEVAMRGSYENVKRAVRNLEENGYPLHAYSMEVSQAQGEIENPDEIDITVTVTTYSRLAPEEPLEFSGN